MLRLKRRRAMTRKLSVRIPRGGRNSGHQSPANRRLFVAEAPTIPHSVSGQRYGWMNGARSYGRSVGDREEHGWLAESLVRHRHGSWRVGPTGAPLAALKGRSIPAAATLITNPCWISAFQNEPCSRPVQFRRALHSTGLYWKTRLHYCLAKNFRENLGANRVQ